MQRRIYVCSNCLRRSCWDGILYCDEYKEAGLVLKTKQQLDDLSREHSSYYVEYFESGDTDDPEKAADELTSQAQELDMGYGPSQEKPAEGLREESRKK